MYALYIKERENLDEIKTEKGFIHYRPEHGYGWINDYFVLPEFRREGHGYYLADLVFKEFKEMGVSEVYCQSDESASGHDLSRKSILNYGFEEIGKKDTIYLYRMEVSKWERKSEE